MKSKQIKQKLKGLKNFDICFFVTFTCYNQSLISGRETRLGAKFCLQPTASKIFLIFLSFLMFNFFFFFLCGDRGPPRGENAVGLKCLMFKILSRSTSREVTRVQSL